MELKLIIFLKISIIFIENFIYSNVKVLIECIFDRKYPSVLNSEDKLDLKISKTT